MNILAANLDFASFSFILSSLFAFRLNMFHPALLSSYSRISLAEARFVRSNARSLPVHPPHPLQQAHRYRAGCEDLLRFLLPVLERDRKSSGLILSSFIDLHLDFLAAFYHTESSSDCQLFQIRFTRIVIDFQRFPGRRRRNNRAIGHLLQLVAQRHQVGIELMQLIR